MRSITPKKRIAMSGLASSRSSSTAASRPRKSRSCAVRATGSGPSVSSSVPRPIGSARRSMALRRGLDHAEQTNRDERERLEQELERTASSPKKSRSSAARATGSGPSVNSSVPKPIGSAPRSMRYVGPSSTPSKRTMTGDLLSMPSEPFVPRNKTPSDMTRRSCVYSSSSRSRTRNSLRGSLRSDRLSLRPLMMLGARPRFPVQLNESSPSSPQSVEPDDVS